ncbi:MAG TPA: hypothetical protein VFH92_01370 [Phenylobacterium sp.]|nr:hypothetical protein [Phenylobacterium sp.]
MAQANKNIRRGATAQIVDFDEALLDACEPRARAELLLEAQLLAGAFAPGGDAAALTRMAGQLSAGKRDAEMDRAHARRLAAALKRLARGG